MSDDTRINAANSATESTQEDEMAAGNTDSVEAVNTAAESQSASSNDIPVDEADAFPREYVESLRKESAGYRERAKTAEERADTLARRLHAALVTATGKLVDPDALPFDAEHLDDDQKLSAAIDALTDAKPYLKARKVAGDAGQGNRGGADTGVNLLDLLRGNR